MEDLNSVINAALQRRKDHPYVVAPIYERPKPPEPVLCECGHKAEGHFDSVTSLGKRCMNCMDCSGFVARKP